MADSIQTAAAREHDLQGKLDAMWLTVESGLCRCPANCFCRAGTETAPCHGAAKPAQAPVHESGQPAANSGAPGARPSFSNSSLEALDLAMVEDLEEDPAAAAAAAVAAVEATGPATRSTT